VSKQKQSPFFISAQRHDKDRIEIKFGCDEIPEEYKHKIDYQVKLLMFTPRTLGLENFEDLSSLRQEFRSYNRLHTVSSNPKNEFASDRIESRFKKMISSKDYQSIQIFGSEVHAYFKGKRKKIIYQINKNKSSKFLLEDLNQAKKTISILRDYLLKESLEKKQIIELEQDSYPYQLLLLNEYVSHAYMQFLGKINSKLKNKTNYSEVISFIQNENNKEFESRSAFGLQNDFSKDEESTENYLARISMLKKYFQKSLFIKSKEINPNEKLLFPVYALAAAIVALWASTIQIFFFKKYGPRMVSFIIVAVFAYIVKDLVKDYLRKKIMAKGSTFLPDIKKTLSLKRKQKEYKLGTIKEYLSFCEAEDIPKEVLNYRYENSTNSQLQRYIDEDILLFKKQVSLNLQELNKKDPFDWGFREIIRFRIERLLGSMSDPFKTLHSVSDSKKIETTKAHRIYKMVVLACIYEGKDESENLHSFRGFEFDIDKNGVLKCNPLKKASIKI